MLVVPVGGGRVRREDPWGWMASQFLVGYSVPNGTFRCFHKHAHTQTQTGSWESSGHRGRSGQGQGPATVVIPAHSRQRLSSYQ